MFEMYLIFGFIDFYSLKQTFFIFQYDMHIIQPHWRTVQFVADCIINSVLIFPGYWSKACWAVDFLCCGRRNLLSSVAALPGGLQVCLASGAQPCHWGHGQLSGNCGTPPCVLHWLTMKAVMELPLIPEMVPLKSFRMAAGSLLMYPCEDKLQALWLLAHCHLQ